METRLQFWAVALGCGGLAWGCEGRVSRFQSAKVSGAGLFGGVGPERTSVPQGLPHLEPCAGGVSPAS